MDLPESTVAFGASTCRVASSRPPDTPQGNERRRPPPSSSDLVIFPNRVSTAIIMPPQYKKPLRRPSNINVEFRIWSGSCHEAPVSSYTHSYAWSLNIGRRRNDAPKSVEVIEGLTIPRTGSRYPNGDAESSNVCNDSPLLRRWRTANRQSDESDRRTDHSCWYG